MRVPWLRQGGAPRRREPSAADVTTEGSSKDDLHFGHAHGHAHPARRASRRVRLLLGAALVPVLLVTVLGVVLLWPHGPSALGSVEVLAGGSVYLQVDVTGAPPGGLGDGIVGVAGVLDDGTKVTVQVPPEQMDAGLGRGDRIKVLRVTGAQVIGSPYIFVDYVRSVPIGLLAIVYATIVVLVARWRGVAAVAGLVISLTGIGLFTLPALLAGSSGLAVGLVTASALMFVVLYLAHGFTARTTTALLGTIAGLAVTGALGWWAAGAANLTGLVGEDALQLPAYAPAVDLRGVVLCGLILAGLGVLNDVTITQASAVWELHATRPDASRRELFTSAMRIGRDHIASTVYTIAFAYVGAALPMLLLVSLLAVPLGHTLTSGEIAEEVVRTLVSSIGLVLAIPLTTAVAVVAVGADPPAGERASASAPGADPVSLAGHGRR